MVSIGFRRSAGALTVAAAWIFVTALGASTAWAQAQPEAAPVASPAPAAAEAQPAAAAGKLDSIAVFDRNEGKKKPEKEKEKATVISGVTVTGSHVKRADTETSQPVQTLTRKDLERTGNTTVGDILQGVPSAGAALNTTFNNGGTGATEVDLRNLGSKRVLVLVDGHRWIAGLSPLSTSSIDLNTIPLAVVDRIDILQDGASAAYGSDAITGVINIITKKRSEGIQFSTQTGAYLQGDGLNQLHSLGAGHSFGNLLGRTSVYGSFSFQDQRSVFAGDRDISALPKINTGLTRGSSFLPNGRDLFVPNQQNSAMQNAAMNGRCPSLAGGVAQGTIDSNYPPGAQTVDPGNGLPPVSTPAPGTPPGGYPPVGVPTGPGSQLPVGVNLCDLTHVDGAGTASQTADYRGFQNPSDFYNYALANYLSTPLRTYNSFVTLNHDFNEHVAFSLQLLDSDRSSRQELAPQPICIGNLCPIQSGLIPGQSLAYNQASYVGRNNPYNPFGGPTGQDIGRIDPNDPSNAGCDPTQPNGGANCNVGLVGQGAVLRRFVEAGSRIQEQHVPTQIARGGFTGNFPVFDQTIDFEAGYSYGQSRETNRLSNLIRLDRLQQSLGDGNCTAPCVPLNILGAAGSITPEMLAYLTYTDYASTKQKQSDSYLNLSTSLPLGRWLPGPLGIAFGVERRSSHYTYLPSLEAINGTTSGLTSLATDGAITGKESFLELNLPLLAKLPFVYGLELDLAGRSSDYGRFGSSDDGKIGIKYRPYRDLMLRGSFSTSYRAPDAGELYLGGAGSFPALVDPCVATNGRRTTGGNVDTNCSADGVSSDTKQIAFQISSPIGGNPNLKAENSHSSSFGFVFSPDQISGLDLSVDYFKIILNNFISVPGG